MLTVIRNFEAHLRNHVTAGGIRNLRPVPLRMSFASWQKSLRRLPGFTVWIGYAGGSVMSTAAPTFALSMPLSLRPATSVSKAAAARVMVISALALTTTPCCRSRRRALYWHTGSGGHHQCIWAAAGSDAVQYPIAFEYQPNGAGILRPTIRRFVCCGSPVKPVCPPDFRSQQDEESV